MEVAMVTDGQVRKLRRLLASGDRLNSAARKTGMDDKTARKYRDGEGLPSQRNAPRHWRTREDPFVEVWPEVQARLEAEPRLRAFALFAWLQENHRGRFADSLRRTFERRVRDWRGQHGPSQKVIFPQIHDPGGLGASDFTNMNALGITIGRRPFDHLLYHFTLTYSNWEFTAICFSESFEAVSSGLQQAFWELGGVPAKHRSDSLSAAVNNLSEDREFRKRYRDLMDYYQVEPQRTNARQAHENGDVESSHGHLKTAIDQAFLLRGNRDFVSRDEYQQFLTQLVAHRNAGRAAKFAQEQPCLGELPPQKLDHRRHISCIKVHGSSTIQVRRNTYSVPSRLIGRQVDVVIDADEIEVWCAGTKIQTMPRLAGDGKHAINYRHVIDSLVRKPGALENYQYHADMFPTSHFRMAYDQLLEGHSPRVAAREYLQILHLAAHDSQDAVQDALRLAIGENQPITAELIRTAVERHQQAPPVTEVNVELPDLSEFDCLLQHSYLSHFDKEVDNHEDTHKENPTEQPECRVDGTTAGTATADVPRTFRHSGPTGDDRVDQPHELSFGTGGVGMPGAPGESDRADDESIATPFVEDVEQFRVDAASAASLSAIGIAPRRFVLGSPREPAAVRQAGQRQESLLVRLGRAIGAAWSFGTVHDVYSLGAATADCQAGLAVTQDDQEALAFRCSDHRRLGLCATDSRGDGGAVHLAGRALRTGQRAADQQPPLQQVGADIQGRHDHSGGHRPISASQRDPGIERPELPAGKCKKAPDKGSTKRNRKGIVIVAKAER
jgi:hypothetical protein